jgi:hypothetical protein
MNLLPSVGCEPVLAKGLECELLAFPVEQGTQRPPHGQWSNHGRRAPLRTRSGTDALRTTSRMINADLCPERLGEAGGFVWLS